MQIRPREFLYVSNLLSLSRLVIVIPIWYLIKVNTPAGNRWLFLLAVLGILSDILDGWYSRRYHQVTDLGKLLDPLADKVGMAVIMVGLILYRDFPLDLTIFLLYRDLMIVVVGWFAMRRSQQVVMANILGKLNTMILSVPIVLSMVGVTNAFYEWSLVAGYIIIPVSGYGYLLVGERMLFDRPAHRYLFRGAMLALTAAVVWLTLVWT